MCHTPTHKQPHIPRTSYTTHKYTTHPHKRHAHPQKNPESEILTPPCPFLLGDIAQFINLLGLSFLLEEFGWQCLPCLPQRIRVRTGVPRGTVPCDQESSAELRQCCPSPLSGARPPERVTQTASPPALTQGRPCASCDSGVARWGHRRPPGHLDNNALAARRNSSVVGKACLCTKDISGAYPTSQDSCPVLPFALTSKSMTNTFL